MVSPRALAATGLLVWVFVGCGQREEIRRYQVAKQRAEAGENSAVGPIGQMAAAGTPHGPVGGRMLGAIVPRGDRAWFFKAVGPVDQMADYLDEFRAFVRSIRFAGEEPALDLPAGWRRQSASGMRFATIEFGPEEDPIELSVIALAIPDGEVDQCVVLNVNRWRQQMGLEPQSAAELAEQTEEIPVDGATAFLVDLTGRQFE
jgi:hypothetical protein